MGVANGLLYKLLASAFLYPDLKQAEKMKRVFDEIEDAGSISPLQSLCSLAMTTPQPDLQKEHIRLFGIKGLSPLELSRYMSNDEFLQARKMADMAGFYRAWGLEVGDGERPDNLSAAFDYLSFMHLKEEHAILKGHLDKIGLIQKARDSFLSEHLLPSIGEFVKRLKANSKNPFYKALAELICDVLDEEKCALTK